MIVRSANGTYEFIDFRETAPAKAYEDMYKDNEEASLTGGLAPGVPGELRGLQHLHDNYGVLPWSTVLLPAVNVARQGWTVNQDLVNYMNSAIGSTGNATSNFLVDDPAFALDFAPHGRLVTLNETITRKRYADTLETIAYEGPDAFYSGSIAQGTIRAIQARNGTMTLEDLKNYTVAIRKPSTITYRDYKLTACSAPSGGEVMLSILKILEGYDDIGDPSAINLTTHRLDEAMKFAYGMRTELGDPSYISGIDTYQEAMVSAATVRNTLVDVDMSCT
jgi:gamma-glutamyltranspeptidase/glutathione hydrolase